MVVRYQIPLSIRERIFTNAERERRSELFVTTLGPAKPAGLQGIDRRRSTLVETTITSAVGRLPTVDPPPPRLSDRRSFAGLNQAAYILGARESRVTGV